MPAVKAAVAAAMAEPTDPAEEASKSFTPIYEIAERMKKDLGERGWQYEAAEDIAASFIKEQIKYALAELAQAAGRATPK
jgi:hypothetical protein